MKEIETQNMLLSDELRYSQFLIFTVSENLFGIEIRYVKEVVELDYIYHIPLVSPTIAGVINLRGLVIPVVDLSIRFYAHIAEKNVSSKIIVLEFEDKEDIVQIGILVDSVLSVIDIPQEKIEGAPAFGSNIRSDFLANSTKHEDEFIILLDIHKVLDIDELSELNSEDIGAQRMTLAEIVNNEDIVFEISDKAEDSVQGENNFVIFSIDNETYGIAVKRLHEIITPSEIISIPNTLPFMLGLINLRGTVVPLVDMRMRCNLKEEHYEKTPWVLVVDVQGIQIGLVIGTVSNLISIESTMIQKTVHYSSNIDSDFISGIAEVKGELIIILDVDKILTTKELESLPRGDGKKKY